MAGSVNGFSDPFGRCARGPSLDRSGRSDRPIDRSGAASAAKVPLRVDFAPALEALEKANAHVQNARVLFQQADSLRPSQTAKYGPNALADADSAATNPRVDPVRRGGLDRRG
jgi:hypothetical protein